MRAHSSFLGRGGVEGISVLIWVKYKTVILVRPLLFTHFTLDYLSSMVSNYGTNQRLSMIVIDLNLIMLCCALAPPYLVFARTIIF